MNERQTKIYSITVTKFLNFKEAWDSAQAYRKQLNKWCVKDDYSAICVIGISDNDLTFGEMHYGYRGKKEFVKTSAFDFITDKAKRPYIPDVIKKPHLHIILFCKPGKTLREKTKKYFKDKGRGFRINNYFNCAVHTTLKYAMMQSKKTVRTYKNVDELPQLALREFVKSAESVNRLMNGNKPIFFRLSLSQELFRADASVLEEDNSDVFADYCLSRKKLEKLRSEEGQMFEMYRKRKQTSEVFTAPVINNTTEDINVSGANIEVFTEIMAPQCDIAEEKVNNSNNISDINDRSNSISELVCNINNIASNINNISSTPYSPPYSKARTHSPPVPQNVIDGMFYFLESILPGFDSS